MSKATSAEWFEKSWNPINGRCPHNCVDLEGQQYCYMWRPGGIADRFKKVHDHPLMLNEKILNNPPKSGRVLVGSSTDMWANEVPSKWLASVMCKCHANDFKGVYFFLTKNPRRYFTTQLIGHNSDRHWYGTTWDGTQRTKGIVDYISDLGRIGFNTYISFEPLLSNPIGRFDFSSIKRIIIGADSRKGNTEKVLIIRKKVI